jgi:hypothetical protein
VPIAVSCPGCRADIQAPDRLAGKLIRCTSCDEEFRVGEDQQHDEYVNEEPRPRAKPPRRKPSGARTGLIVGGSIAVVLLLTIARVGLKMSKLGKIRTEPIPAMTAQVITLSNLRRDGNGYSVDYTFTGAPGMGQVYSLKVRRENGTADVPFPFLWREPKGSVNVTKIGGGTVEVYFVHAGGERVSNIETLK